MKDPNATDTIVTRMTRCIRAQEKATALGVNVYTYTMTKYKQSNCNV